MTKREWEEWASLRDQLATLGIGPDDAVRLRRAARTLHRWAELECGDEFGRCVERDEKTGKPWLIREPWNGEGPRIRSRIRDYEKGAIRTVRAILEPLGLHFYHQGDPRGPALYVGREPFPDFDHSRGIAVY